MPDFSITCIIGIASWLALAYSLYVLTYAIYRRELWAKHSASRDVDAAPSYVVARSSEMPRPTRYHDGEREVTYTFIPASDVRPLTTVERIRHRVEMWLGQKMDWHPLSPLPPLCGPDEVVVYWRSNSQEVSVVLSGDEAERYRAVCTPLHARFSEPVVPGSAPASSAS
ncbi:serine/threonine protein kinase [Apiospora saccharicola]